MIEVRRRIDTPVRVDGAICYLEIVTLAVIGVLLLKTRPNQGPNLWLRQIYSEKITSSQFPPFKLLQTIFRASYLDYWSYQCACLEINPPPSIAEQQSLLHFLGARQRFDSYSITQYRISPNQARSPAATYRHVFIIITIIKQNILSRWRDTSASASNANTVYMFGYTCKCALFAYRLGHRVILIKSIYSFRRKMRRIARDGTVQHSMRKLGENMNKGQCTFYILRRLEKYINYVEIYIEKVFKLKIRIVIK